MLPAGYQDIDAKRVNLYLRLAELVTGCQAAFKELHCVVKRLPQKFRTGLPTFKTGPQPVALRRANRARMQAGQAVFPPPVPPPCDNEEQLQRALAIQAYPPKKSGGHHGQESPRARWLPLSVFLGGPLIRLAREISEGNCHLSGLPYR